MIFSLPRQIVLDIDGSPVAGALAYFYQAGTSTPQAVYDGEGNALPNPVQADGFGVLPTIHLKESSPSYKVTVSRPDGTSLYTEDNVPSRQSAAQAGTATFANSTTVVVAFSPVEPDTNYRVVLGPRGNKTFWVTSKTTTGFTLNASSTSTDLVDWVVLR